MKTDSRYSPHFALLAVQLMFGAFPVVGKFALASFSSFAVVGFRVGGAAAAFVALQMLSGGMRLERRSDYWRFLLYAILGVILNQLLSITGLSLTTASNSALLAAMMPIFVTVISAVFGYDKLNLLKTIGILLAAAGVVYLINPLQASFSSEHARGDVMIILNGICYATYLAISKDAIKRNGALRSLAWLFLFGSIVCLPIGAWAIAQTDFSVVTGGSWIAVVLMVLFPTIGAYYLNAWALARVEPSVVAVYIYLQPLIGFLLAVWFLGEQFTLRAVTAGLLIFIGVFLVTRRAVYQTLEAETHATAP